MVTHSHKKSGEALNKDGVLTDCLALRERDWLVDSDDKYSYSYM